MNTFRDLQHNNRTRCGCLRGQIADLGTLLGALLLAACATIQVAAQPSIAVQRLLLAYPDHILAIDGNTLVFKDGARLPIDDGRGAKTFNQRLADPDLKDMFAIPYQAGPLSDAPTRDWDPGRARSAAFFDRIYGNCRKGEVERHLVEINWLPSKANQRLRVTKINGVADKLEAVSRELDKLSSKFDAFLAPAAGTYNCRSIAGTDRVSPHGYGIAIDIAPRYAHYWHWTKPSADDRYPYRNAIPLEIVHIFEVHGFIWGGKWYHYDTMHFEYRPELLPTSPAGAP